MKPLHFPLRAVLYKEGDNWIAHCLELDLLGDGTTQKDALESLSRAIVAQVQTCAKYSNPAGLFSPADGKYFRMFAAGKNVFSGSFRLVPQTEVENVTIEDFQAREYSEAPDTDPDLVPA